MQVETLVRMGEQIARNHSALPDDRAVARIAGHLRSFWTPAMIAQLADYARAGPERLDRNLVKALGQL